MKCFLFVTIYDNISNCETWLQKPDIRSRLDMLKGVDNIVLVSLVEWAGRLGSQAELSAKLMISPATLTRSLQRLELARLAVRANLSAVKPHAEEYFGYALRFVFPARLGPRVRGVPTAHSAPFFSDEISGAESIVWPAEFGKTTGLELAPLHPKVPALSIAYPELHLVFAILDLLRVGRARERALATGHLRRWLQK
jgi:hypothetical protein